MGKRKKKKSGKTLAIIIAVIVILALVALYTEYAYELPFATDIVEDDNGNDVNGNGESIPEVNEIPDEEKNLHVEIFLGDEKAISDDERGEYGYVTPVKRTISFTPDEEEALQKTLKELISGARANENYLVNPVPTSVNIMEITIEGTNEDEESEEAEENEENEEASAKTGTATIGLSQEAVTEAMGGAVGGTLFTESIVYTATQFPSIDNVLVTVDGAPWSDGHVIWSDPLGRDDLY